jgi:RiboL-PSP-HEPN
VKSRLLLSQHQRIVGLIESTARLPADQIELQAHWARYLCVLAAGFIETALVDVYSAYTKSHSHPTVTDFVESALSRIQNPKASRFLEIAGTFDREWTDGLTDFLNQSGRKDAIDGIMSNRHLIAHGKDSGISLVRVKDYLKKSVEVIEFIEAQCRL